MGWRRRTLWWLRALFQREKLDADTDEELRFHLDMRTAENLESGMDPEEARYAALRRFGWIESIREACREQRGVRWLEDFLQDLRRAFRPLRKTPAFTALAIVTLGLGIGSTTAVLSLLDKLVLRPFPGGDLQRLVSLREFDASKQWRFVSAPVLKALVNETNLFEGVCAFRPLTIWLRGAMLPERFTGFRVSANFFDVLGVPAVLGRTFQAADVAPGKERVLVISHDFWQRRYRGAPSVVGSVLLLARLPHRIIGVMPARFQFPHGKEHSEFWLPYQFTRQDLEPSQLGNREWEVLARLGPNVRLRQLQSALDHLVQRLSADLPLQEQGWNHIQATPTRYLLLDTDLHQTLIGLFGGSVLLLVMSSANVANLLLSRAEARRKQLAVQIAIGAGPARTFRGLALEIGLLVLASLPLGLTTACAVVEATARFAPTYLPRFRELGLDGEIFGLAAGLALLVCGVVTLGPAWCVWRTRLIEALKESGPLQTVSARRRAWLDALATLEVAAATVLLLGAGVLVHNVLQRVNVNLGFDPKGLLFVVFEGASAPGTDPLQRNAVHTRVEARLRALSETRAVAAFLGVDRVRVKGQGQRASPLFGLMGVGVKGDFFETLGAPLRLGRRFDEADTSKEAGSVIINEQAAQALWPSENPLGKRLSFASGGPSEPLEVVGVVANVRHWRLTPIFTAPKPGSGPQGTVQEWRLSGPSEPMAYLPCERRADTGRAFLIRAADEPSTLGGPIQDLARELFPAAPPPLIRLLEQELAARTRIPRVLALVVCVYATAVLLISALGLYGVLASSVIQRTKEIGIRMTLGATPRNILTTMMKRGARLAVAGLGLGLAVGWNLIRLVPDSMPLWSGLPPWVLLAVPALLALVTWLACWPPARRAARVDPILALRYE